MSIKRVKIDTWDGGIINSDRSVNFTDGAAMVKNFDIYSDNKKLSPLPTFDLWVTDQERNYNLTALDFDASTTTDDTVFSTGRYIKNWLSPNYPYRVALTPNTTNVVVLGEQMGFDLSRLGSDFWDNITADENDVDIAMSVVTNGSHKPIPFDVVALDVTNQKGWVFFVPQLANYTGTSYDSTVYLYWGSGDQITSARNYTRTLGSRAAYTANAVFHFDNYANQLQVAVNPATPEYPDTEDFSLTENNNYNSLEYVDLDGVTDGVVGNFMHSATGVTVNVSSDNDDPVNDYNGSQDEISISFNIYLTAAPAVSYEIVGIGNKPVYVLLAIDRKLNFYIDREGSTTVGIVSTTALSLNTLYRVRFEYGEDTTHNIYINGVVDTIGTVRAEEIENADLSDVPAITVTGHPDVYIQNLVIANGISASGERALQDYKMLFENENCYTIGTVEEFTDITPSYAGMTIYSKALGDTTWTQEQLSNAIPLQIDSNTPLDSGYNINVANPALIPTFISYDGSSTLGKKFALLFVDGEQADVNTASRYILVTNNEDLTFPIDGVQLPSSVFLGSFSNAGIIPNAGLSIANVFYLSTPGSTLYSYDGGNLASAFSAYPTVSSIDNYSGYLAIGGFRDNKSFCQLWDRSSTTASQFIDFGIGWLKVLGVVKGNILAVIDGFIDNTNKSVSKPYIEVRRWTGGTTYDTPARIELPANYTTGFDEEYLSSVYNKKAYSKNALLFYAKIPTDDTLTTFNEGFWGVGVNERTGKVALCLMYDTDGYQKVLDYTSVANNVFFSTEGGEVMRLTSGNYSKTSSWESLKFEGDVINTNKKLHSVSVVTEPLDTDQEITLYYKRSSDTDWVEIGTMTADNAEDGVKKEFTRSTVDNFPIFRSVQFKIESKNGSAAVLELAFRYEELTTKV